MTADPNGVISLFLRGSGMGAGLGGTFLIIKLLFGRIDKKEAHVDAATKSLIEAFREEIARLATECHHLRERADATDKKLHECEERDAKRHAELLQVKALLQAKGEIKNSIQAGLAAEKLLGDGSKA